MPALASCMRPGQTLIALPLPAPAATPLCLHAHIVGGGVVQAGTDAGFGRGMGFRCVDRAKPTQARVCLPRLGLLPSASAPTWTHHATTCVCLARPPPPCVCVCALLVPPAANRDAVVRHAVLPHHRRLRSRGEPLCSTWHGLGRGGCRSDPNRACDDSGTRCSAAGCLPANAATTQIITPFNVYFNAKLIFTKFELWRLITNFFFFGNLGASGVAALVRFGDGAGRRRVPAKLGLGNRAGWSWSGSGRGTTRPCCLPVRLYPHQCTTPSLPGPLDGRGVLGGGPWPRRAHSCSGIGRLGGARWPALVTPCGLLCCRCATVRLGRPAVCCACSVCRPRLCVPHVLFDKVLQVP